MRRVPILLIGIVVVSVDVLAQTGTASLERRAGQDREPSGTTSKRMADGKQWTTQNLNVNTAQSYCYEDAELNCRQYGRLYAWQSARTGCQSLRDGWRLPTDDEWRQMANHYGGLLEDSPDGAKETYHALIIGGTSGFNATFGGRPKFRPADMKRIASFMGLLLGTVSEKTGFRPHGQLFS